MGTECLKTFLPFPLCATSKSEKFAGKQNRFQNQLNGDTLLKIIIFIGEVLEENNDKKLVIQPVIQKCIKAIQEDEETYLQALLELFSLINESMQGQQLNSRMLKHVSNHNANFPDDDNQKMSTLNPLFTLLWDLKMFPIQIEGIMLPSTLAFKRLPEKISENKTVCPGKATSLFDFEEFNVIQNYSLGTVLNVTHKHTKQKFALKTTHELYYTDLELLTKLRSKNLIKVMNIWKENVKDEIIDLHPVFQEYEGIHCIQMELCSGRNLNTWILRPPWAKTVNDAKRIICQISQGIKHLHQNKIIHKNLKPSNILLQHKYEKDQNDLLIKIGDFGMAADTFETYREDRNHRVSPDSKSEKYMSPEQKKFNTVFDEAVDVFSMGVIFAEVLLSSVEKSVPLKRPSTTLPHVFDVRFMKEKTLLSSMMNFDPTRRPSASQVLKTLKSTTKT